MKRIALYLVLILVNVVALELLLSVYFFQRRGDYPSAIVHYAVHQIERLRIAVDHGTEQGIGIYKDDPELGFDNLANASGKHKTSEFAVTYTIDAEKGRRIPAPERPRGRIYFLGCSYTFGWGVEDNQNYPYLLATKHWADWEVKNRSVNGWGTVHAYLVLRKELEKISGPAIFIYGITPDHIPRNYIRKEWITSLAKSNRKHPYFDLNEGVLKFHGTVGVLESKQGDEEVRRKELELTSAFLVAMHRLSSERNIPFIVILLPQKHRVAWGWNDWPPEKVKVLVENRIPFLDLTEMKERLDYIKYDVHPTARGHELIADAIARSFVSDVVKKR